MAAAAGVFGSSLAPYLVERFGRPRVLLVAAGLGAVVLVVLSAAPSLAFVVVIWSIGAGLSGVTLVIGRGFVQRHCPNELLGRAAIASRTITRSAFVVGALLGGVVATVWDIRSAYVMAGIVQALALPLMRRALQHDHD